LGGYEEDVGKIERRSGRRCRWEQERELEVEVEMI